MNEAEREGFIIVILLVIGFIVVMSLAVFFDLENKRFCEKNPLNDKCLTEEEQCKRDCPLLLEMDFFKFEERFGLTDCWCINKEKKEVKQVW